MAGRDEAVQPDHLARAAARDASAALPRAGGTYALVLRLDKTRLLRVGRLGTFEFPRGYYVYIGSALNGLRGRVNRHLRASRPRRWHIDFLNGPASVVEVWWAADATRRECEWAAAASAMPGARLPAPRFGSSDCKCPAHLAYLPQRPRARDFESALRDASPVSVCPPTACSGTG